MPKCGCSKRTEDIARKARAKTAAKSMSAEKFKSREKPLQATKKDQVV